MFYWKIALFFVFFFFAIMLIVAIPIYNAADHTLKKQLSNNCKGIAITVAALIEKDIEQYTNFIATLDTQSDYYKKTKAVLENIKIGNGDNITYLYTEIRVSDTEMMYVFDSELESSDNFTPPGIRELLTQSNRQAYETKRATVGDFELTHWGNIMSAYAPIYNKKTGEFVGLVGADISIDHYNEIMQYQLAIIAGSIAVLSLVILSALLISSGWMEKMLITDKLTGVFNRRFFESELAARAKLADTKSTLFVFMVDLDDFKQINDTYGHIFGDKVLGNTATTMASVLRTSECLARYGGEEFAVCLSDVTAQEAFAIAERLRAAVEDAKTYNREHDKYVFITISIGIAMHRAGQPTVQVIKNADKSLYDAKIRKNTIVMFEDN